MKQYTALLLIAALLCGLFAGCAKEEEPYVPTGNALVMEGEEPNDFLDDEEEVQELTLAYYPDRSMNPLIGVNISNRLLMSLMYQGLFATSNKDVTYPILCASWKVTPNNMNYTVYLESNATFSDGTPVTVEDVDTHVMHSEYYQVTQEAADTLNAIRAKGGRIICVGTTSVRTLETVATEDGVVHAGAGDTAIFIYPGKKIKAVDALITNFHLPQSTLLMLVSTFMGRDTALDVYREAVEEKYRFFSFGDAMFIE